MTIIKSVNLNQNKNLSALFELNPKVIKINNIDNIKLDELQIFEPKPLIKQKVIDNKNILKQNIHNKKIQPLGNINFKIFGKNFIYKKNIKNSNFESLQDNFYNILNPPLFYENLKLFKPLWETQVKGIKFLVSNEVALLADDPGLGKTIQSILAMRILFRDQLIKRALIIAPKSTIGSEIDISKDGKPNQWLGHLKYWAKELRVYTVLSEFRKDKEFKPRGKFRRFRRRSISTNYNTLTYSMLRQKDWQSDAHVFVSTYGQIRNDIQNNAVPLDMFDLIILDEVHNVKNPSSQQSLALRELTSKFKWGLSGTPVQNYPRELYGIFQFLHPQKFPNLYKDEYEKLTEKDVTKITKSYFLRRTKSKDELPPKSRSNHWLMLTHEQQINYKKRYKIRRDKLIDLLDKNKSKYQTRQSIFAALIDLLQICNFSPTDFSSNKINLVREILQDASINNEKTIIFSRFLDYGINRIEKDLLENKMLPLSLKGDMSYYERNSVLNLFKTNTNHNILCSTIFVGGVGLNIPEASVIIHFDHWWNPAVMWQAEDRAHRFGQTKEVKVHSFFTKDTIEEKIFNLLKSKEKMINNIMSRLGTEEAIMEIEKQIDDDDLMSIFEI